MSSIRYFYELHFAIIGRSYLHLASSLDLISRIMYFMFVVGESEERKDC